MKNNMTSCIGFYPLNSNFDEVICDHLQANYRCSFFNKKCTEDIDMSNKLTPVIEALGRHGLFYVKRDDLFEFGGAYGGKVRTCVALAKNVTGLLSGKKLGTPARGLVTAGSRSSPQCNIVAAVARELGIPARVHCPTGELGPELLAAQAKGATVIQHRPGYNSVIIKRARDDAFDCGYTNIPFGMECNEAVLQTAGQVENIPADVKRIVMPVGSGMSLAGVVWGLMESGRKDVRVVGVVVGADPHKRLDMYAPPGWRDMVTLLPAGVPYDKKVGMNIGSIVLDPIYEAKVAGGLARMREQQWPHKGGPELGLGDLFWIVGVRENV